MRDIDNRALIETLRRRDRRVDLKPGESLFMALLFFVAALLILFRALEWI